MVVPAKTLSAVFDILMFPSLETYNRAPRTMILSATSRHLLRRLSAPGQCPRTAPHDGKRVVSVQSFFNATGGVWIREKTEYSDTCPKVITVGAALGKGCLSKVFLQWLVDL